MFLVKFCNVVANETYVSGLQLVDIMKHEYFSFQKSLRTKKTKSQLEKMMRQAQTYAEWKTYAQQYDNFDDIKEWKEKEESSAYDWKYIKYLAQLLRELRQKDLYMKLIHVIRSHSVRNLGNVLNSTLYSKSFLGSKRIIENFHQEMILCIEYISMLPDSKLPKKKKLEFFTETRHAFGRTALAFSGGASLGQYHYGVIKCLFEEDLLPKVISGSSVGSIFASFLCTKTAQELEIFKDPNSIQIPDYFAETAKETVWSKLKRLLKEGYFMRVEDIRDFVRGNLGDETFQEAYDRTGRILNVTVTGQDEHDGYRLLNYLTAPNVVIWSAVCASCAVPYVFSSVDLYCKDEQGNIGPYMPESIKRFVDGTLSADVPTKELSELFNVNYIIVSQVNPMITIFLNYSEKHRHSPITILFKAVEFVKDIIGSEFKHRLNQIAQLGIFPKAIARYVSILTQQYSGDVTVWPTPTLTDLIHVFDHPNTISLTRGRTLGARGTYYKLNNIEAVMGIEKALQKAHTFVRQSFDEVKTLSGEELYEMDSDKKLVQYKPQDSIFSSESESEELSRLCSFMIPRTTSDELFRSLPKKGNKKKRSNPKVSSEERNENQQEEDEEKIKTTKILEVVI